VCLRGPHAVGLLRSGTISLDEFLILYRKVVLPQNLYGTYVDMQDMRIQWLVLVLDASGDVVDAVRC